MKMKIYATRKLFQAGILPHPPATEDVGALAERLREVAWDAFNRFTDLHPLVGPQGLTNLIALDRELRSTKGKWVLGAGCVNSARPDLRGAEGQCGAS
jgi:hypothetical protein